MGEIDYKKIEKIIHYGFKNKDILKTAFTHSSYANQHNVESYERYEYLGDSILNFVIADALFKNYENEQEGVLTKWRAKLVNSENLSYIIKELDLEKFVLIGDSAKKQDFTKSMREDLFESIVGAIYLDSSLEKARRFILRFIDTTNMNNKKDIDYKSLLQEKIQGTRGANLVYFTYEDPIEKGRFCSEVYINDIFVARAFSRSKKNAQLECAKLALSDDKTLDKILN